MTKEPWHCPEALRHDEDRTGHCRWCGQKCASAIPRPRRPTNGWEPTELDFAYGEFWDPDYWYDPPRGKHYDC